MDVPSRPAVVLTRSLEDNQRLAHALRARGVCVHELPCLHIRYLQPVAPKPAQVAVFSSRHGVRGWLRSRLQLPEPCARAAVGPTTAAELAAAGLPARWVADPPEGNVLAQLLCRHLPAAARVLLVRGNLRAGKLEPILRTAGFELDSVQVYSNEEVDLPPTPPFPVAMVFCASPSAAHRLLAAHPWLQGAPFACIGGTTAHALQDLGIDAPVQMGKEFDNWLETLARAACSAENQSHT